MNLNTFVLLSQDASDDVKGVIPPRSLREGGAHQNVPRARRGGDGRAGMAHGAADGAVPGEARGASLTLA